MALTPKKRTFEYSETHHQQIKTIKAFMAQNGFSQSGMAKLARLNDGTFSSVLSGKYPTDPSKHLMKAINAIENFEPSKTHQLDAVLQTTVFKTVQTACTMARRHKNFAVVSAYVGLGKTMGAKSYAKDDANVHLIEADPTMTTTTLINHLVRSLNTVGGRTVAEKFETVVAELKGSDSLIIIDEAETLTPKALHLIRRIRDKAGIGIVLLGTEYLTGIIAPEHGQFDQIRSRVGFWPQTIQTATREDCEMVCLARLGSETSDEVIERLWQYSRGSMRMLSEGLLTAIDTYRKDRDLTVELVDAIADQALTLKPLAKSA